MFSGAVFSSMKDRGAVVWGMRMGSDFALSTIHSDSTTHTHAMNIIFPPPSCPSSNTTSSLFTPLHEDICSLSVAAIVALRTNMGFSHWWCEIKQPPRPLMISSVLSSCCGYLLSHSTRSRFQGWSWELEFTIVKKKNFQEGTWRRNSFKNHVRTSFWFLIFCCLWLNSIWYSVGQEFYTESPSPCCTHVHFMLRFHENKHTKDFFIVENLWFTGENSIQYNYILFKETQ